MKTIDKILNFFKALSYKDFLKYSIIFIGSILLFTTLMIYRYFSTTNALKKELKKVNNLRQEAQNILSRDIQVKKQKAIVDELIQKGKNFKLIQFFDETTAHLGIQSNIASRELTTNELENLRDQGYIEVSLSIQITDINMKQLVQLLDEFEKNERIYVKNLEITKSESTPTINVNITIATIQPKEETGVVNE